MADLYHLLTERDLEAYADGALTAGRRRVVEELMLTDEPVRTRIAALQRNNAGLRALKSVLYRDPDLHAQVQRILVQRLRPAAQAASCAG